MTLDIDTVEAILREHWQMPSDLDPEKLHDQAFKIQVLVGQKYSYDNLKYQLNLIQTKKLLLTCDHEACGHIATKLINAANV